MSTNGNQPTNGVQSALIKWLVSQGVAVVLAAYVLLTLGTKLDQVASEYAFVQTQLVHQTDIIAQQCK